MARSTSPVTTKAWNPVLPPEGPLPIRFADGTGIELEYAGRIPMQTGGKQLAYAARYVGYGYILIVSIDHTQHGRLLHFSVSASDHLAPWDLVSAIKSALFPNGVAAVMHLPEAEVFVNLHEFTLHVWQLPTTWGVS